MRAIGLFTTIYYVNDVAYIGSPLHAIKKKNYRYILSYFIKQIKHYNILPILLSSKYILKYVLKLSSFENIRSTINVIIFF